MRRGQPAGDLCHRESGFVQEIAQEVALRSRQNVWVDGSLRDGHWFSSVFADIRRRFPDYKIAIFVVSASEETVRRRVAERERRTVERFAEREIKRRAKITAFASLEIPL